MDFFWFVVVVVLFCVGGGIAIWGLIGKEPVARLDLNPYTRGFDQPPAERPPAVPNRGRLMLIGVGSMVLAVVLGFVVL